MKKTVLVILVFMILALVLTFCGQKDETPDFEEKNSLGNFGTSQPNDEQATEEHDNENLVYEQYKNLVRIDQFQNGIARFLIHEATSTTHWSTESGRWSGDYYYGFMDVHGNVVIEPIYECGPRDELPDFKYNYIKVENSNDREYIIDKKGDICFELGKDNITGIGQTSQGYFWIETVEEHVSGNVYTVNYYSANDLSVIAAFDNIRAIPDDRTIGGMNSTLSETGEAKLTYNLDLGYWYDDDLFVFNISEYDDNYKTDETRFTVDLTQIEEFSSATRYYHISSEDNTKGPLATVALRNSNGTWFYSVVDSHGNVLMSPQMTVSFPLEEKSDEIHKYDFCKNLCPAKDTKSGLWGYIDPEGNWKIQPQFSSATAFSSDGYATVDQKTVINTKGEAILSPLK